MGPDISKMPINHVVHLARVLSIGPYLDTQRLKDNEDLVRVALQEQLIQSIFVSKNTTIHGVTGRKDTGRRWNASRLPERTTTRTRPVAFLLMSSAYDRPCQRMHSGALPTCIL